MQTQEIESLVEAGIRVEVRPLPRGKVWHGKEGQDSFRRPIGFEVLIDPNTGRYATGLTPEQAEEYGKKLGVDLSDVFKPDEAHPYWSSSAARIKLIDGTMVFDTNKPQDFIKVANLKASRFVANSMEEWEQGLYPEATHVIHDESADVRIKATKFQQKKQAFSVAMGLSTDEQVNIIMVMSNIPLRGRSQNFIDVEIGKLIEEKPAEFIGWAKADKNSVYTRSLVLEAIHRGVLNKEGSSIMFMGDMIGYDIENTVKYFEDPTNQAMKANILNRIHNQTPAGSKPIVKKEIPVTKQENIGGTGNVETKTETVTTNTTNTETTKVEDKK